VSAPRRGGIVIGRFMPPHAGHEYLIQFAASFCRDLTVFVCTLASEPIPGDLRFRWMTELFPDVHLVHITEEIPQASRSSEGAHAIWAQAIRARMDTDPRYVFASEGYGLDLADALGAQFVPVDPQREVFPISAGMIRESPIKHWRYIPDVVRPYFARKLVVIDSSSTIVPELARRYETVHATDYPKYIRSLGLAEPAIHEVADLARAQAASEEALLRQANRVVFTPTDALLVLTEAGLPATERDAAMERLIAEHPTLAPSLVVAAEPVSDAYRAAVESYGWTFLRAENREHAERKIVAHLEDWFAQT